MSAACPMCHGTGEKGHYGILDCDHPQCTAAVERAALNAALPPMTKYDLVWYAYQAGKRAAGPDLLATLKDCYDLIAEEVADGEYTEQARKARAAIIKAGGEV